MSPNSTPSTGPSELGLAVRQTCILSVLGVYCVLALLTTGAIVYRQTRACDVFLMNRSVPLVAFQAVSGLIAGSLGLAGSALHEYPCAIKLWVLYLGVLLWLAAVAVRAAQKWFLFLKLSSTPSSTVGCGSLLSTNSPPNNTTLCRPDTSQTLDAWSGLSPSGKQSQSSVVRLHADHCVPPCHARYGRYFADGVLLASLVLLGVLMAIVALVINTQSPAYTFQRLNIRSVCRENGWELWPAYGAALACVGVGFPVLTYKLWSVRDPYGACSDILVCMGIAQFALVLFVLWQTVLDRVRVYVSELVVIWLAVLAGHISSVCCPLWRSTRYQLQLADRPSQSGLSSKHKGSRLRRSIYLPQFGKFCKMIEDSEQRHLFLLYTAKYYCTAIPAFLESFQMLKLKVIDALKQHIHIQAPAACCHQHQHSASSASSDSKFASVAATADSLAMLDSAQSPAQAMSNAHISRESSSLTADTPVTKGIYESAMLVLPAESVDENTLLPDVLMSSFSSLVNTYFLPGSFMSINVPGHVVDDIQSAILTSSVTLSVLDKAKDEVLFLLCTDVYSGYRKRLEARNTAGQSGADAAI
ncbi:hypothetical protein GGI04_000250 [Coemansia thaxteri]|nr:hypothetical protein GGI04_000250 [Coemansia thaxteri]KAJ2474345.1 hypothetical protein GGI02_000142 [Coemansia sp. RSA 2322]